MVQVGIKEEFDRYVRNAELEGFVLDKCPQYYHLTDSFVNHIKNHHYLSSPFKEVTHLVGSTI